MGEDFWKYGVAENMPEIEALSQYVYEQGLTDVLGWLWDAVAEPVLPLNAASPL